MTRWLAGAMVLALGCSGSSTMKHEELESELKALRSLQSEVVVLNEAVAEGKLTTTFARGHTRYLQQAAQDHLQKLAAKAPASADEAALRRLRAGFDTLLNRLQ